MGESIIATAEISGDALEMSEYLEGLGDRLDDDDYGYGDVHLTISGVVSADISGGNIEVSKYLYGLSKRLAARAKETNSAGKLILKLVET